MRLPQAEVAEGEAASSSTQVPRPIAILGCTGSIGQNVLRVIAEMPGAFEVVGLAAGTNVDELASQILRFGPRIVSLKDEGHARGLRERLSSLARKPEIFWGEAGLDAVANGSLEQTSEASRPLVVAAMVGIDGLRATYDAVSRGCDVALANKETIVAAGELIMKAASLSGANVLPVDSEPNAIHQCLRAGEHDEVRRVILTASGGPFRDLPSGQLAQVSPEEALRHPIWKMGRRITIDSATLMNKGFEIIEACHLFGLHESQVDVLIHRQSVVHSLVEFRDGSLLAQLGVPDMRTPIQYALTFPQRAASNRQRLRLEQTGRLDFELPDEQKFPALALARAAHRSGGIHPAVLNAADEVAVAGFCERQISFAAITEVVAEVLERLPCRPAPNVDAVLEADAEARGIASRLVKRLAAEASSGTRRPLLD
jgi:1-deoxy-D-xylulose-5-phosphate reductoisomerase